MKFGIVLWSKKEAKGSGWNLRWRKNDSVVLGEVVSV